MKHSLQVVYEHFFPYRDKNVAEDFANSTEYDMAQVYLDNLQIEPSVEEYNCIVKITQQIKDMVMSEYSFWLHDDDETGDKELRAEWRQNIKINTD